MSVTGGFLNGSVIMRRTALLRGVSDSGPCNGGALFLANILVAIVLVLIFITGVVSNRVNRALAG